MILYSQLQSACLTIGFWHTLLELLLLALECRRDHDDRSTSHPKSTNCFLPDEPDQEIYSLGMLFGYRFVTRRTEPTELVF